MHSLILILGVAWLWTLESFAQEFTSCDQTTGILFHEITIPNIPGVNESTTFGLAFEVLNPLDPVASASIVGTFTVPIKYGWAGVCLGNISNATAELSPICMLGWVFGPGSNGALSIELGAWEVQSIETVDDGILDRLLPGPSFVLISDSIDEGAGTASISFACVDCFAFLNSSSFDITQPEPLVSFAAAQSSPTDPSMDNTTIPFGPQDFSIIAWNMTDMNATAGIDCRNT